MFRFSTSRDYSFKSLLSLWLHVLSSRWTEGFTGSFKCHNVQNKSWYITRRGCRTVLEVHGMVQITSTHQNWIVILTVWEKYNIQMTYTCFVVTETNDPAHEFKLKWWFKVKCEALLWSRLKQNAKKRFHNQNQQMSSDRKRLVCHRDGYGILQTEQEMMKGTRLQQEEILRSKADNFSWVPRKLVEYFEE